MRAQVVSSKQLDHGELFHEKHYSFPEIKTSKNVRQQDDKTCEKRVFRVLSLWCVALKVIMNFEGFRSFVAR